MNRQESSLLHSRITESFRTLPPSTKVDKLRNFNLSITPNGTSDQQLKQAFDEVRDLGFTPFKLYCIFQGIAWLMHNERITMPLGKKQKQERGRITDEMLNKLIVEETDNHTFSVNIPLQNGVKYNILNNSDPLSDWLENEAKALAQDTMILGRVLNKARDLANRYTSLAFGENIPGQIQEKGPRILLQQTNTSLNTDLRRKADHTINATNPNVIRFGVLREIVRQGQLDVRRHDLQQFLEAEDGIKVPKFKLNNWPTDALMANTRRQVATVVDSYIANNNILCDPQDLKYQTLFRLTTYSISDVYINGSELDNYLHNQSAYGNWRNILNLAPSFVQQFNIQPNLLKATIEEQYQIIKERLQNSSLPLEKILPKSGIFAEPGWVIQKRGNGIFATQEEGITAATGLIPLEFREVDPKLAKKYHSDLHYIHTPRADLAFGLYIQGDDLPFSVLALEKIDRPYKQNVLLMQGYNPRFCYDLTRLYSRPGTPGNTSSSVFALTFNYMKSHYPETQAVVSAFMPSYATGVSMTSGGFENPILIKPLIHNFEERTINGKTAWENVTKRRQQKGEVKRITSQFPLLPTVELMSSLQSPRYPPLPGSKDFMIEII